MTLELNRTDLLSLAKGSKPYYTAFDNELVVKAGHCYSDQYGTTTWSNLSSLNDEELYQLYIICRDSWK